MEQQTKENGFLISEFPGVRSKSPRVISLEQFVATLTGDKYRTHVAEYRRLAATPGCEEQAKALKEDTPCIVPAGVCRGGHKVSQLVQHSGLLCIDLDHTDSRTAEILQAVSALPWVLVAFVSISGCGVKVLVRVHPEALKRGYEALYHAVGRAVSRAASHPYDEKCKILTQPCYYSHDPGAYYNPEAACFEVTEEEADEAGKAAPQQEAAGGEGFLPAFLGDFERRHPFRRGERNDIALALGREAACKGFSTDELEQLTQLFIRRYAVSDFTADDIQQRVSAGYQYIIERKVQKKAAQRVHFGSRVHYDPSDDRNEEDTKADLLEKNNELRAATPCIPEEVYRRLPEFLQRCVRPAGDLRERDLLLLGSLTCCSAALPNITFLYRNVSNSPHFYLAVVAPAGSGKGVLSFAVLLLDAIQDFYDNQRRTQKKQYEEAQIRWEKELADAKQEKRKVDITLKPEEPRLPYFKISPTTSKNRFIESLAAANRTGCFMCSTEIVTLISALGQDYGRFEDILLKSAHHEEVSSSFKIDHEPIVVREPRLALLLSGTQEQFNAFFRSLEAGLYSRFAFYTRPQNLCWESCEPDGSGTDLRTYYRDMGRELLKMHHTLLGSPTLVSFTHEQWQRHTAYFSQRLAETVVEGGDAIQGILFRHGLLTCRLAAVFTAFRKCADYPECKEYICTDEDFDTALQLADTLLSHSLLLATSLPESLHTPTAMRKVDRIPLILGRLEKKFSYTDFLKTAEEEDISRTTAKRMLNKCITMKLVKKEEDMYHKVKEDRVVEGS